jgi:hypothetical protein
VHAVEEAIGANDNFAMRQIRKLGQLAPGVGEALQAPKGALCAVTKAASGSWVVAMDVGEAFEEALARRRREPDPHGLGVLEELVRFAEDGVEEGPLAGLHLSFSPGEG